MRVLLVTSSIDPALQKGIARYTTELFNGLKKHIEVDLLVVGSTGVRRYLEAHSLLLFKLICKAHKYDVIHAVEPVLGTFLPFITRNSVVTFNDIFALTWKQKRWSAVLVEFYFHSVYLAAANANRLIAISSLTAADLTSHLQIPMSKIDIVNLGINSKFRPLLKPKKQTANIGFFANFGYRKRVDMIVDVFRQVRQAGIDCKLILAGGNIPGTVYERLFNVKELTNSMDGVTILGHIPEAEIVELYNSFDVFIFPSETEGFGFPILEAQRCGVPVLVRSDAAIPSEVTVAAIKCLDVNEMVTQVTKLLTDSDYYQEIRRAGLEYSAQFTWANVINKTLEVYEKATGA